MFVFSIAVVKQMESKQVRRSGDFIRKEMSIRDDEPTQGKNSTPQKKTKL